MNKPTKHQVSGVWKYGFYFYFVCVDMYYVVQVTSSEEEKTALQHQVTDLCTRLQDTRLYVTQLEEENVSCYYKQSFSEQG
jgi:hypothetical protein